MALLTMAEFCNICGIESKHITTYASRKKIVLSGDYVDDANQVNQLFISKRQIQLAKKSDNPAPVKGKTTSAKKTGAIDKKDDVEEVSGLVMLEKVKRDLDIVKKQNEIKLQEMEIKKRNGELVPTEAVKSLIIAHSESLKNSYYEAGENLIIDMSAVKQFSSVEVSELKTKLRDMVNKSLDSAIRTSKKSLTKIVDEYSEKRGVGQHG